jgi:hypothetical protein
MAQSPSMDSDFDDPADLPEGWAERDTCQPR